MASAKLSLFPTALVAQWIEQEPSNLLVAGSIPAEGASLGGMSSRVNVEALTRKFISAYEQKDIGAIAEMFAPNVVLRDWNSEVVGFKSAIVEFTNNFQAAESLRIKIQNLMVTGSFAAAELEIVINGIEILRVVDVLSFSEDQKILSIVAYKGL